MVFVGDTGVPGQSFPNPPYTTVTTTPTVARSRTCTSTPPATTTCSCPRTGRNSPGTSWAERQHAGHLAADQLVLPGARRATRAATINAALAAGQDLIFTPGVYQTSTARSTSPTRTPWCSASAWPRWSPTAAAGDLQTADVNGIRIGGLIVDAGTTNSLGAHAGRPVRLERQPRDRPDRAVRRLLPHRRRRRPARRRRRCMVNSANVIGDDLWLWRADHGNGGTVGWTTNTAANGLVVNGANVTMYGLAVEHYQQYQVAVERQRRPDYFYQSEMPYDPPNQSSWMDGSADGYPVDQRRQLRHQLPGLRPRRVLLLQPNPSVIAANALTSPACRRPVARHGHRLARRHRHDPAHHQRHRRHG